MHKIKTNKQTTTVKRWNKNPSNNPSHLVISPKTAIVVELVQLLTNKRGMIEVAVSIVAVVLRRVERQALSGEEGTTERRCFDVLVKTR